MDEKTQIKLDKEQSMRQRKKQMKTTQNQLKDPTYINQGPKGCVLCTNTTLFGLECQLAFSNHVCIPQKGNKFLFRAAPMAELTMRHLLTFLTPHWPTNPGLP